MYMKYFLLDLAKSCNDKFIQHKISKFYVHNLDNGYERLAMKMDMDSTFDLLYVMLGVNNLTTKHGNGKITPVFDDVPTLVEFMLSKFEIFKYQIHDLAANCTLSTDRVKHRSL